MKTPSPRVPRLISAIFFSLYASMLSAEPFRILNRTSDLNSGVPIEAAALAALNAAANAIENTVNSQVLSRDNRLAFADGLSRASTASVSGLSIDRASDPGVFVLGLGVQAGLYLPPSGFSADASNKIPPAGLAGQASVLLGIRPSVLGVRRLFGLDPRRCLLYLSGLSVSQHYQNVQVQLFNLGLHGQYQAVMPRGIPFLGWGGIRLGTGLHVANNTVTYAASLQQTSTQSDSGQSATVNVDLQYELGGASTLVQIPFEASTSIELFYLLTFYGGIGADVHFGSSRMIGTASGPITATTATSFGASNPFSGSGSLQLDDGTSVSPVLVGMRTFGGIQANFWMARAAVEVTTTTGGGVGATAFLKLVL